ncbi:hypothetical protein DHL47_04920 [Streptococcus panodentis]|uniref:Uncharacterized protein n=1 Tax=Streptococcus panodentis TaxID=1581472 RepID=A0ABS5AYB8_9STRE|nr:hypothetical protein [Streptococcus panodentis]
MLNENHQQTRQEQTGWQRAAQSSALRLRIKLPRGSVKSAADEAETDSHDGCVLTHRGMDLWEDTV